MLTFTPYHHWKWEHAVHHATNGDLDKRGIGDIWTLTVQEYLASSRWVKISYRFLRNPFILFGLAPLFLFFVLERFPSKKCKPRERRSVYIMNLALLVLVFGNECDFWIPSIFIDSGYYDGSGWHLRNLAVLCTASV